MTHQKLKSRTVAQIRKTEMKIKLQLKAGASLSGQTKPAFSIHNCEAEN